MTNPSHKLETGVPQLDSILGGGVTEGDVLLVVGAPGSGKTTLAFQTAFHAASKGQNAVYVSTLSEPAARLVKHMRAFSFWNEALIGRQIFLRSVFPLARGGLSDIAAALDQTVREHDAKLLVVDGFNT